MSVFTGHVDKHGGVVVRSSAMEELDPAEFGPKLKSKFFAYICFLISPFQGRRVSLSIGYQTRCRRRRRDLYSKPVGGYRSNGLLPRSHDAESSSPHSIPSICYNATLRKRDRILQSSNERTVERFINPIQYNTLSENIRILYFFFFFYTNLIGLLIELSDTGHFPTTDIVR